MKKKLKLAKDNMNKLCKNLFSNKNKMRAKNLISKTLDIMFIRKPLKNSNKFTKLLVQIPLGFIYVCIFIGISDSYYTHHTFPDANRPTVCLAQIQQEEYEAKIAKEDQDKLLEENRKKEDEELSQKRMLEEKDRLAKEEAEKKKVDELKKQEEQKKLEEEIKSKEVAEKKIEEERIQKEKQAKEQEEARQSQQSRNRQNPSKSQSTQGGGYYIAAYGGRVYHRIPNCRHMNHPIEVDLNYIQNNGLRACKNCHH